MLANGVIVDIKTGKPVNEKPKEDEAEVKQEETKSTKRDKK